MTRDATPPAPPLRDECYTFVQALKNESKTDV